MLGTETTSVSAVTLKKVDAPVATYLKDIPIQVRF